VFRHFPANKRLPLHGTPGTDYQAIYGIDQFKLRQPLVTRRTVNQCGGYFNQVIAP
jgi:hypothetical protein